MFHPKFYLLLSKAKLIYIFFLWNFFMLTSEDGIQICPHNTNALDIDWYNYVTFAVYSNSTLVNKLKSIEIFIKSLVNYFLKITTKIL